MSLLWGKLFIRHFSFLEGEGGGNQTFFLLVFYSFECESTENIFSLFLDVPDPGVGEFCALPLDHINICKPDSRDSTLYQRSLAFMHRAIFYSYMHRLRQAVSSGKD